MIFTTRGGVDTISAGLSRIHPAPAIPCQAATMTEIPDDLALAAYKLADRWRAEGMPGSETVEGSQNSRERLLIQLQDACLGYSDQQYRDALAQGLFDSSAARMSDDLPIVALVAGPVVPR